MEKESKKLSAATSTDQVIPVKIQDGLEKMIAQGAMGFVVGGMAGIILSRGGASGARRVLAGFGTGCGFGAAWTKTSMDIDDFLSTMPKE
tara:strand:+ start:295 stop:564 length:270 start_codon:yes stop_codon:yes gene_type:complete